MIKSRESEEQNCRHCLYAKVGWDKKLYCKKHGYQKIQFFLKCCDYNDDLLTPEFFKRVERLEEVIFVIVYISMMMGIIYLNRILWF